MEVSGVGSGILFENYYSNLFKSRWENLYKSLKNPVKNIALIPPFYFDIPLQNDFNHSNLNSTDYNNLDSINDNVTDFTEDFTEIPDDAYVYKPTILPWCYEVTLKALVDPKDHDKLLFNKNIFDANGYVSRLIDHIYYLDGASAFAAFCLEAKPGDKVLDMCSSPGGKMIILASNLFHSTINGISGLTNGIKGSNMTTTELIDEIKNRMNESKMGSNSSETLLVCNEPVKSRYKRLIETSKRLIPDKFISGKHIQFVNYDATDPNKFQRFGKFDKILIDAPCSSERHLINKNLSWSFKNIKENSKRQLKLLQTAISLLKSGGTILYCTCALDPIENELVINTILKNYDDIKHVPINYNDLVNNININNLKILESTDYNKFKPEKRTHGCSIMPDKSEFGPLYIAKLQKL
uniref:NOL1/NOP2/Sun domain family member 4 n=1 Tax=Theileria annulata TaxID=5874 RepID=A0A3B0MHA9_THEAN